jgi:hypothetical protein
MLQSPPARTERIVRAGGLGITSRDFQSLGLSYPVGVASPKGETEVRDLRKNNIPDICGFRFRLRSTSEG